ncbi:MAG: aldehyde dehydrogenase family protein, partial [Candidatus Acidiferrales bacterium]
MAIATINPATGEMLKTFDPISDTELEEKLQLSVCAFNDFRKTSFASRAAMMVKAAEILEADKEKLGRVMTTEMGKTYRSAVDEAAKCAWVCRYYAENAEKFLADEAADV